MCASVCVSVGSLPSLPSDWVCDGSPDPTRLAGVLIFYYYFFLPTAVNNGFFLFFFGTGVSPFGTEVGGGGAQTPESQNSDAPLRTFLVLSLAQRV